MRAGVRLFAAVLRMSLRNRQGLFWTLFFPVLFMLAASLFSARPAFAEEGSSGATYLEFALSGLIGVTIMNASLAAIGMGLTTWREKGILKRLRATPLTPAALLGGLVANQVLIGAVSVALMLLLAVAAFGARVHLDLGPLTALVLAGLVVFLALGFFLSGLARRPESVPPLVNLIALPMMLLSGVFFPMESLPHWVQAAAGILPLTFLVDGLRDVMSAGAGWPDIARHLAGLGAWAAATVVAAIRTFRWDGG
ncbi:MAG TPA: ABC transporter permease [Limnochordales bacterium]